MSDKTYRFEATMPPVRQTDIANGHGDRAASLVEALQRPGSWASDVERLGKVVTWTTTIPEGIDGHDYHITDTVEQVGYHCSDTVGPKSRKAKLKVKVGDGEWVGPFVCPGAW